MELGVFAHPVAIAADIDEMAVVQHSIDKSRSHDVITKHLAPLLKSLVGSEHGRGA